MQDYRRYHKGRREIFGSFSNHEMVFLIFPIINIQSTALVSLLKISKLFQCVLDNMELFLSSIVWENKSRFVQRLDNKAKFSLLEIESNVVH